MTTSPEFSRVISVRSFLQPRFIPTTILALLAAGLLFALLFVSGATVWLLVEAFRPVDPASQDGFRQLSGQLESTIAGRAVAFCIESFPALTSNRSALVTLIVIIVVLILLRSCCQYFSLSLMERQVAISILRLRQHLHRKAIRLEPGDLTGEQTRAADGLFQNTASVLENTAVRWGRIWVVTVPDVAVAMIAGLVTDWRLTLQASIPVIIGRLCLRAEAGRSDASLRLLSEQVRRGLSKMAESLKKTRIVTSFGMEQTEQQQFESHMAEYLTRCRLMNQQQSRGRGIQKIIRVLMIFFPVSILAFHVLNGMHPAIASVVGSSSIVLCLGMQYLEMMRELAVVGSDKADEIASYINRIPGVSQAPGARFLEPMSRTLTFNQISYQTPQLPGLLRGLDLRISFGEKVALLSLQPAPANALAGMIPRFLDPDLGQVLIDGVDIRKATLESLRAEALLVGGQDPVFNASVLENITCGQPDISRQQATDAAKLVHADQFIRNLPRGYETVLGEHGTDLEPGQIFRLSLARAAVRAPALLVIEEPQVALDAETKALLDDAYQRISSGRTVIFLPFRLSTVKRCSRIVLIHEGRVAADGTHEQLVRTSEIYRHWEYVRFNPHREDVD